MLGHYVTRLANEYHQEAATWARTRAKTQPLFGATQLRLADVCTKELTLSLATFMTT